VTGGIDTPTVPGRRERAINAPRVVVALIAFLIAAHGLRVLTGASLQPFAATAQDLKQGDWTQFVTYQFVHGGWPHVLMNAAFILAFGAPVARYFGEGPLGAAVFMAFFIVCGVFAGITYGELLAVLARIAHATPANWGLVGASGAASGLMGGAIRLIQGHGRVGRLGGRTVVGASLGWIAVNIILGVTGLTPGAGLASVAWEAHITGYFAGLLLIGAFGRLAGQSRLRQGG
jgi:membrane associated rhomboid family serine protease